MNITAYELEVFAPLFYSSFEGNVISTEGIISSTALNYALADALRLRDKDYFLYGAEAITPKYEELKEIPLFSTDAVPMLLKHTSIEFRSTRFWAEENILVPSQSAPYPKIMEKASKSPFFKQVRRYVGIDIGSKFQVIIVSKEKLPDELFVNVGIRRSGELRLKKLNELPNHVTTNYFMLDKVYQVPKDKLLSKGSKIVKSGDYRMLFIKDMPLKHFKDEICPIIVQKWKQ